ncbi:hypothetical protein HK100_004515 [Physocladia obscura]|uniref:GATA-type domain-containing protein n=1 Tax=Physocladia obscura TaxID=109957 RepID=A0AAD5ST06_9FUNG|nr:hypothetical protein HK100_004515 [Physocladia obscura]
MTLTALTAVDQIQSSSWIVASDGTPVPIDQKTPYEFLLSCVEDIHFSAATKCGKQGDSISYYFELISNNRVLVDSAKPLMSNNFGSISYPTDKTNANDTPPQSPHQDDQQTRRHFYKTTAQASLTPAATVAQLESESQVQQLRPLVISIKQYSTKKLSGGARKYCFNCRASDTPVWRKDEMENPICNACGIFLKLHGYARPSSFPFRKAVVQKRPGRKSGRSRLMQQKKITLSTANISVKTAVIVGGNV